MKVRKEVAEVLEDLFDDVRYDYSGRGMYGDECFGIVTADNDWAAEVYNLREDYEGDEEFEEFFDALLSRAPRSDSMGLSIIYYWPAVQVTEEDEDE